MRRYLLLTLFALVLILVQVSCSFERRGEMKSTLPGPEEVKVQDPAPVAMQPTPPPASSYEAPSTQPMSPPPPEVPSPAVVRPETQPQTMPGDPEEQKEGF